MAYRRPVPRETQKQKRARALEVLDALAASMPDARIELDYRTPLELLVAVILSAQCTDKRVNLVTPALFARFADAAAYAEATEADVGTLIRSLGLYQSKAKNLVALGRALLESHGGEVPTEREVLETLPGVGHKTAGVVSLHLGGTQAFPVDTHVQRLSVRLGFTRQTQPDKVEDELQALFPEERWGAGHQLLVWHGRRTCFARSPECERCVVLALCPRIGVTPGGKRAPRART